VLACPLCQDDCLKFDKPDIFVCNTCGRKYPIINIKGHNVPNFLIEENWKRGFRGLKGKILIKMSGKPFVRYKEKRKLILDVGCGENPRGNINLDCYIPKRIPENFILANAAFLPFRKESIDIVLSNYSIEHMINPAEFIQNIVKISKGKIEIVTDNSEWFGDIIFRLIGSGRIFHDEHYYKWSKEYMSNLLKRVGVRKYNVILKNLSSNIFVILFSRLGGIPRIGNFFYRDLVIEIRK